MLKIEIVTYFLIFVRNLDKGGANNLFSRNKFLHISRKKKCKWDFSNKATIFNALLTILVYANTMRRRTNREHYYNNTVFYIKFGVFPNICR